MLDIYVDADACPVKDEVFRVSRRYGLRVFVVCNHFLRLPNDASIQLVQVGKGFDEADDWIAERVGEGDIVITADIPLAARVLDKGGRALGHKGRPFTPDSIGTALAMRELSEVLRGAGEFTGGPAPMGKKDRSRFLSKLDEIINAVKRSHSATTTRPG